MSNFSDRMKEIGLTEEDTLFKPGIAMDDAASYTLVGFKSAYSTLTYEKFIELLDGRDDGYWKEKWDYFRQSARLIGKLGTFFPILVNYGHEIRKEKE